MSIPLSGAFATRSRGLMSSIAKEMRAINFKLVDKIVVQFDPFYKNVNETRKFLFHISSKAVKKTNPLCALKTKIVCDQSEPIVTFDLTSGNKVIFKCGNLNVLNILQYCNKHVSSLVPPPEKTPKEILLEEKKKQRKKKWQKIKPFAKRRGVFY
ncbi:PREDICTED: uncharacterized protein LOC107063885 [Polistes dominula]|uniref:Large ribosomal subunit protein mL53 n=1 Tax=Polistes dominula TaxID=743375 RepID=A0ABM1HU75_POLDO|nr:PREDICTED: uncharacterized protein LOC107063885 [Polistes dominula]